MNNLQNENKIFNLTNSILSILEIIDKKRNRKEIDLKTSDQLLCSMAL